MKQWFLTFLISFCVGLIGGRYGLVTAESSYDGYQQPQHISSPCSWVKGVWTCNGVARGINFPSNSPSPLPVTLAPIPTPSPSPDPNECGILCIILIVLCVLLAIGVAGFIWYLRRERRKTAFVGDDFDQEAQKNQEKLAAEKAAQAEVVEEPKEVEKEVEPEPEEEDDNISDADGSTVAVDSVDANLSEEDEMYKEGRETLNAPETGSLTPRQFPKPDLDLEQEVALGEDEEEVVSPRRRTIGSLEVSSNSLRDYRTSMQGD